ncbi:MAG: hypothetical protein WBC67_16860 [Candidatus Acidiferrales bacterium]
MKMLYSLVLCGVILMLMVAAIPPANQAEMAQSADAFVGSVGVNVHLHYTNTPYGDFPSVERALKDLGARHIRDALLDTSWAPYYDRINDLGRLGIKGIFITNPKESDSLLMDFPSRVPESFEGYEAPNEYDSSHDPDWAATLSVFVTRLHDAVKSNRATSAYPIIGPSLTQPKSFLKVAALAPLFDYANLHNYFGGRNPGTSGWGGGGYGSINWNLNLAKQAWAGKPIMTTETGYLTDVSKTQGVPENVAGKYLPRLLLEQWEHGIQRTYIYQLLDLGNKKFADDSFGLLHADFSPKPGYTAIQNIIRLLSDPGPSFHPGELDYSVTGDVAGVDHALFEKRDGTFFLALWVEKPSYDVDAKKVLPVAVHKISIQMQSPMTLGVHTLDDAGAMHTAAIGTAQAASLKLDDKVTILELHSTP